MIVLSHPLLETQTPSSSVLFPQVFMGLGTNMLKYCSAQGDNVHFSRNLEMNDLTQEADLKETLRASGRWVRGSSDHWAHRRLQLCPHERPTLAKFPCMLNGCVCIRFFLLLWKLPYSYFWNGARGGTLDIKAKHWTMTLYKRSQGVLASITD